MKHVGVNVAADAFMYASMTGIEAGLVIVSADDPAMHSSQNEQDNRRSRASPASPASSRATARKPRTSTVAAFEISERFDTPVMLRMTTRVCHSTSAVETGRARRAQAAVEKFPRNPAKYVMVPVNARHRHPLIEQRMRLTSRSLPRTFAVQPRRDPGDAPSASSPAAWPTSTPARSSPTPPSCTWG